MMLRYPFWNTQTMTREMERLQREMNRLFADFPGSVARPASAYPAMNVWTNDDGVIITAELPGCNPDNIDISVVGNTLSVSGSRPEEEVPEDTRYHRRERGCGQFNRSFQLPFAVEAGRTEAAFENGVLHITLPRAEADKPKKIAVKMA